MPAPPRRVSRHALRDAPRPCGSDIMQSLSTISYRSLLVRKARYVLTALGVTFGVAVLFGVLVTAGVTRRALDDTVRGGMGRADVVVGPVGTFDSVLPRCTDARVAALPGVQQVTGSVNVRSLLQPAPPPGQLLSLGSQTRN